MTPTPLQRSMIVVAVGGLLTVGTLAYSLVSLVPAWRAARQAIDDRRASIVVISQEQSNLERLSQNIENLKKQQEDLRQYIWSFTNEDEFFNVWPNLAATNHIRIDTPHIAEATPNDQPVNRAVMIEMSGPVSDVLTAVQALQRTNPLVSIQRITLKNTPVMQTVTATIEAQTLWQ